jgi:peptidoglycan biosynthesis protein MviN/MurJ (putative lipid II flippase)
MGPRIFTRLILVVQAAAALCLCKTNSYLLIAIATVVAGSFATGAVPLFLARTHDLVSHDAGWQNVVWARVTIVTAASMAIAAYVCSGILTASGGNHRLLFLMAAISLLTALFANTMVIFLIGNAAKGKSVKW